MNVFRYAPKNRMAALKKKNEPTVTSTNNPAFQNKLRKITNTDVSNCNQFIFLMKLMSFLKLTVQICARWNIPALESGDQRMLTNFLLSNTTVFHSPLIATATANNAKAKNFSHQTWLLANFIQVSFSFFGKTLNF